MRPTTAPNAPPPSLRMPAEWEPQLAYWLAYPYDARLWQEYLRPAQEEFLNFLHLCAATQDVILLVPDEAVMAHLRGSITSRRVRMIVAPYRDIWLRDTGPIFCHDPMGNTLAVTFRHNGWGEKYLYAQDLHTASFIAQSIPCAQQNHPFVLEGGAVESNGQGVILTTKECLLNPNRNNWTEESAAETALRSAIGATKVVWLNKGLEGDHTDGHIDNLCRFISSHQLVCPVADSEDDPNAQLYDSTYQQLCLQLEQIESLAYIIHRIPSPGRIEDLDGHIMPASYVNFVITNDLVIVPAFGVDTDERARAALEPLFPQHRVVSSQARALLTGGGTFHCMSKQQPL